MAEKSSEYTETFLKHEQGKSEQMSDVATAQFLIEEIGNSRHVGDMIFRTVSELRKRFPHREDPQNQWTERRLKGWWNNESENVKHFQMMELYETAEAVRRARDEHAQFRAKTARLRQMAALRMASSSRTVDTELGG